MKRFLAISAVLAVMLTMAACTGQANREPSSSSDSAASPSSQSSSLSDSGSAPGSSGENALPADVKTGLGTVISLAGSKGATDTAPASSMAEITVCAATFDPDGTILGVVFDVAEAGVEYDQNGALTTDPNAEVKTKRQLGDSYGMGEVSSIGMEWYEQVDALQEWMKGKTAEEVLGMETSARDEASDIPEEEELKSSVTISVTEFLQALEQAYQSAR